MKSMVNVYSNVKRIAKENGIRISEVEKAAGISTGYFSKAKNGKGLSGEALIKAADFLNVTLNALVEDPPPFTNASKFVEVFGFMPGFEVRDNGDLVIPSLNEQFWHSEYEDPQKGAEECI